MENSDGLFAVLLNNQSVHKILTVIKIFRYTSEFSKMILGIFLSPS